MSDVAARATDIRMNAGSYLDLETIQRIEAFDMSAFEAELGDSDQAAFDRIAKEGLDELEGFGRFSKERVEATKQLMHDRRTDGEGTSPLLHGRKVTTVVFLSSSMPGPQLKEALLTIQKTPDTVGVIRGLLPGTTSIPETVLALKNLIDNAELDGVAPSVFIDPTLFTDNAVSKVPTIVHYAGQTPIARVSGLPNAGFVRDEVTKGREGDLGIYGEVFEVAEVNLIDEMKRRVAELDSEAIARQANDRFFDQQPQFPLPVASESQTFTVDMSIRVNEDIRGLDGELIVKRGTVFNPLRAVQLRQALLVFNPDIPAHLQWAEERGRKSLDEGLRPVYIATHIPRSVTGSGWDSVRVINERLPGSDLTVLNRTLVSRFQLQKVPSRLQQQGEMMQLTEVLLSENGEEVF